MIRSVADRLLETLPDWPAGTVAVLATGGGGPPHAIPVSTAIRAGDRAVLFALAPRRTSLARLRADPQCALTIIAHSVAITVDGAATIVAEPLAGAEHVVAVRLDAERIEDHDTPRFEIEAGVSWRWTDREAERDDAKVRAALSRLR